jgi:hypothetical protein
MAGTLADGMPSAAIVLVMSIGLIVSKLLVDHFCDRATRANHCERYAPMSIPTAYVGTAAPSHPRSIQ